MDGSNVHISTVCSSSESGEKYVAATSDFLGASEISALKNRDHPFAKFHTITNKISESKFYQIIIQRS
jgi:hypothetical protein